MADRTQIELKVGFFVLIGLIILVFFVLMIGDFRLVNPGYSFKTIFNFANGIKMSSPVRLSGVEIGEVRGVDIVFDEQLKKQKVFIKVWVRRGTKIPVDSRVWVNMLGLLGEKYIEIIPGKDTQNFLKQDSVIKGEDPVAIQELTDLSREIAEKMNGVVGNFSVTLTKLNATLDSLNTMLENAKQGRGNVGKLFFDEGLYNSLNDVLSNVKQGRGTVGKLFNDDKLYNDIEEMFADLKKHPWKLLYRGKE